MRGETGEERMLGQSDRRIKGRNNRRAGRKGLSKREEGR